MAIQSMFCPGRVMFRLPLLPRPGIDRAELNDSTINDEMQILCDADCRADKGLVGRAMKAWIAIYGRHRVFQKPRLDKGKTRSVRHAKPVLGVESAPFSCRLLEFVVWHGVR